VRGPARTRIDDVRIAFACDGVAAFVTGTGGDGAVGEIDSGKWGRVFLGAGGIGAKDTPGRTGLRGAAAPDGDIAADIEQGAEDVEAMGVSGEHGLADDVAFAEGIEVKQLVTEAGDVTGGGVDLPAGKVKTTGSCGEVGGSRKEIGSFSGLPDLEEVAELRAERTAGEARPHFVGVEKGEEVGRGRSEGAIPIQATDFALGIVDAEDAAEAVDLGEDNRLDELGMAFLAGPDDEIEGSAEDEVTLEDELAGRGIVGQLVIGTGPDF